MKKISLLLAMGFTIFTLQYCKDEPLCKDPTNPKCGNYDRCYGKKPVTADFEIGLSENPSVITPFSGMFEEDTIFPKGVLRFRAKIKGAKYTWKLGSETIYDSAFSRLFVNVSYGRYKVTLIIEKEPDLACFPEDDGRDTLTRYFHIVESCKLQTTGSYKGVWEGKKDSFIFKILHMGSKGNLNRWDTCNNTNYEFVIINGRNYNIQQDTLDYSGDAIIGNYYAKILYDFDHKINGEFRINPITRKLRFEYSYNNGDHHVVFNGRKL